MVKRQRIIRCANYGPIHILLHFIMKQLGALALNQRECLSSMLDHIGIALSIGEPLITELSFLRVIEFHWDFNVGGELALGNLVL
jgi:hypothetical protein